MIKVNDISDNELLEIENISEKIRYNTAILQDFKNYENLLVKAGIPIEKVNSNIKKHGFESYDEYYDAKVNAKTKYEKYLLNVTIAAGLVALFGFLLYLYNKRNKKT